MRTDLNGLNALKRLRQEWQEDAGLAYPQEVLPQLLVLYDVCKGLDLNLFEAGAVLGQVLPNEAQQSRLKQPLHTLHLPFWLLPAQIFQFVHLG